MITRDDIIVWNRSNLETGKHETHISVKIGKKEYGVSYSDDKAREHAIPMLVETLMKKEIGIIEHDIRMKVFEFEMGNKE